MKKNSLLILLLFVVSFSFAQQKKCRFDEIYEQALKNEGFKQQQLDQLRLQKEFRYDKMDTVIKIPTVVHIIYKPNTNENISTAQIVSQINVLNEDFRKRNADTTNVVAGFTKSDVKFEFVLATKDPNGNSTNGITRTQTNTDDIGLTNQYFAVQPAWNSERYMNIWVCDVGPNFLGFAYPPNTPGVSPDEDGIVIGPDYFGNIGTAMFPYNKGRTATHEIAHYFNLMHLWGGGQASCSADDGVSDTPKQGVEVYNCPASNFSCGTNDMLSNFLQYVDDRCMGNFTLGQKARMRSALYNFRDSLQYGEALGLTSLSEVPLSSNVKVYPNPTNGRFLIDLPRNVNVNTVKIKIYNYSGKLVSYRTTSLSVGLEVELDVSATGAYFVSIESEDFNFTKKLIKY